MILSLAYLFIFGILSAFIFYQLKLPKIIGLLIVGIIIGPYSLALLHPAILNVSSDIRQIALIIILIRAGLMIKLSDFKQAGRSVILLSFLPACIEMLAYTVLTPLLFPINHVEAALLGSIISAVSPAVVVPRMVSYIEKGTGQKKKIPQLILAGSSFDDVVVIVLFTIFLAFAKNNIFHAYLLLNIPATIISSLLIGWIVAWFVSQFIRMMKQQSHFFNEGYQHLILLSLAFLLVVLESVLSKQLPFSGLLAILMLFMQLNKQLPSNIVTKMSQFFNKLWLVGEIFLFVLVGANVDIRYIFQAGFLAIVLIVLAVICRMIAVLLSVFGNGFTLSEKIFCMIAYLPKATVQAAIGGVPLAMGLHSGQFILSVAVLSILITAPIGAIVLDKFGEKLL